MLTASSFASSIPIMIHLVLKPCTWLAISVKLFSFNASLILWVNIGTANRKMEMYFLIFISIRRFFALPPAYDLEDAPLRGGEREQAWLEDRHYLQWLAAVHGRGRVRRDETVVVSKIGYVQGQNLALAREREAAGQPFPEMVKVGPGIWHCLHPDFLADQLGRSLQRLGLSTLDVGLLHNPEYFLGDGARRGAGSLADRREEFYRRLAAAFRALEGEVDAGRLRWYGVSSNTVAAPPGDPEATSLTRMLEIAGPRFRVLQLPLNLVESGPALRPKDGPDGGATVLEWAAAQGLGVLVNRPLNAIVGSSLLRLAEPPGDADRAPRDLDGLLRGMAALEDEYRATLAPAVRVRPGSPPPGELVRWGGELKGLAAQAGRLADWDAIEGQVVALVGRLVRSLDAGLADDPRWGPWRERYLRTLGPTLGEIRRQAAGRSAAESRRVSGAIDPGLPEDRRREPLSRKALAVLASTPGVTAVLLGMRRPAYVDDALPVLAWPPLDDVRPTYRAVQDAGLARGEV
jgi:hypothetical protein